jgi:hypothetical protein
LSTAKDPTTSSPLLIIGQPGGHFIIIEKNEKETSFPTQVSDDQSGEEFTEVSTEIVKGTKFKNGEIGNELENYYKIDPHKFNKFDFRQMCRCFGTYYYGW